MVEITIIYILPESACAWHIKLEGKESWGKKTGLGLGLGPLCLYLSLSSIVLLLHYHND